MLQQIMAPAIFAIFTIGFALIWQQNRHIAAAGIWALGYFFACLSFALTPTLNNFPQLQLLRPAADAAYLISALLLVIGLGVRYSKKIPTPALATVFSASLAVTYWHWFVVDNYSVRTEALSYGCGALLGIGTWMLYPTLKSNKNHILFWIVTAFSIQAFLLPITAIYILNDRFTQESVGGSIYLELLTLTVSLTAICLATALLVDLGMQIVRRLRDESRTDILTGLLNRRAFETLVDELNERLTKPSSPTVLIVCDLDHFKRVNDTFGHIVGDAVIRGFGDVLKTSCRPGDSIGRIGGEEFGVLLPETSLAMGRLLAEKLRIAFEAHHFTAALGDITPTASFGVAELRAGEKYEKVFSRADAALYAAKKNGRNCVQICEVDTDDNPSVQTAMRAT